MREQQDIPSSETYDVAVVVPTVAFPDTLCPSARRLLAYADGLRVLIVFAFNAPDQALADQAQEEIEGMRRADGVDIDFLRAGQPIGFGAANNRGLMRVIDLAAGLPRLVIFHNDDAHVAKGWLQGMLGAAETKHVSLYSEPYDEQSGKPRKSYPVEAHGRIGIVGPLSNLVAGIQQANPPRSMTVEQVNEWARGMYAEQLVTADFISGFCMGFTAGCIRDLMLYRMEPEGPLCGFAQEVQPVPEGLQPEDIETVGIFDEDCYPIAGYEDNDVCVRAELGGWRCLVASDVFVSHLGHQTFDRLYPEMQRGMRNRLAYYEKWEHMTQAQQRLVGVCRLGLEVPNDLNYFKAAVSRVLQIADGLAIVLTNNPLDVRATMNWGREREALTDEDVEMLKACSGTQEEGVEVVQTRIEEAFAAWVAGFAKQVPEARFGGDEIRVEVWREEFNERDERNRSIAMAEEMGADWILSFDHDEFIENRVWRRHFELLMSHPDPLVRSYDQAWLNHWDSARMCRADPPWGDGGTYQGCMHGFRLWRVTKGFERRIFAGTTNGLHCGNSPDHDMVAKRVSAIRFRHYGYLRPEDRFRKYARYQKQDPNPEADLIGGEDYSHIIRDENCKMYPYVKMNGLGLHMLLYEAEDPGDVARLFDGFRSLLDRVVLVWTGAWEESDQVWLEPWTQEEQAERLDWAAARSAIPEFDHALWEAQNPCPIPARFAEVHALKDEGWPATGPSRAMAKLAALFQAQWVHKPLDSNLAAARNAGLDALQRYAQPEGIGWGFFLDPDEFFQDSYQAGIQLRRMAEASDVHGWLFQVTNLHSGQEPTQSESVRISRLVPPLRMSGRVHEGFEDGLKKLRAMGTEGKFRIATARLIHRGLALDEARINAKLQKYQRLLLLQLDENPQDSGAWMSLGLHLLNDAVADPDREEQGLECFRRGIACEEAGYLPFREMAMYHLRKAVVWFGEAMRRSDGMPWNKANAEFYQMLAENVPEMPLMGSAKRGLPVCPPIELPDFELAPELAEAVEPTLLLGGDPDVLDAADVRGAQGSAEASTDAGAEEPSPAL